MIYKIENDTLRVAISSLGAELQSIRRTDNDIEYLWQGDAAFWARRASNLFPVCGRLTGGGYRYEGQVYEMGSHGFARGKEWSVAQQSEDNITLRLTPDEDTLAQYPFRFCLEMTYALQADTLSVTTVVRNEDDKVMPFAVGGHPGFNVPLADGERFEDYRLVFDNPCQPQWLDTLPETCAFTGKIKEFPLVEERILPLRHSLFDGDAMFLRDTDHGITLCSEKGAHSVHLSFPDSPYLGIWHTPNSEAPFVCIEPWVASPSPVGEMEDIMEKADMIHLNAGDTYRNTYKITIQ